MAFKRRYKKQNDTESKKMGKIKHKKTEIDGIVFDSKMESEYYLHLKQLQEQGIVKSFKLQPAFLLQEKFIVVDGQVILGSHEDFNKIKRKTKALTIQDIKYIADFEVEYADGHIEIVDTKGQETADFKLKKKMFIYKYPHLHLSILIKNKSNEWIPYDKYQKELRARKKNKE